MPIITTKDGVEIFYKDWGKGQPIVFSHGWPLSADDWDTQMLFFLRHGYRVIAHDRRGHGRSTQTGDGHDMDHYADDLAALTAHLDLKNAVHVGHSTGGGEVAHYLGRHGESRVAKAALISAVPPLMVKTAANPGGLPKEVFDGLQAQLAANRSQFYRDLPAGPFYGFNRPGVKASEAIIQNWWRQGMMGGAKAHYDGIVAFSQTDFTDDLKKITVPVLVMHGDDDQIVPYADSGAVVGEATEERDAEDLQGISARHAHHASGHDQRRPARVHQGRQAMMRGGMLPRLPYDGAVDADGHVLEPPDLWDRHLEPRFRDRPLGIRRDADGLEYLEIAGRPSKMVRRNLPQGLGAMDLIGGIPAPPGRDADGARLSRQRRARRVGRDGAARSVSISENLDLAILYPTLGVLWEAECEDLELAQAYTRAYNRWIVEFCAGQRRAARADRASLARAARGSRARARAGGA